MHRSVDFGIACCGTYCRLFDFVDGDSGGVFVRSALTGFVVLGVLITGATFLVVRGGSSTDINIGRFSLTWLFCDGPNTIVLTH